MNKVYRLVRNRSTGTWVPASELARSCNKRGGRAGITPKFMLAAAGIMGAGQALAAEIVIDGGAEETSPGSRPINWYTGARTDLVVGDTGVGMLAIGAGSAVSTQGVGYIGRDAGSDGTVSVSGTGAKWTLRHPDSLYGQDLKVGAGGTGHLYVTDGGQLQVAFISLGGSADGYGTMEVRGTGSLIDAVKLTVGESGKGEMLIAEGGAYVIDTLSTVYIGKNAGSEGTLTVDGPGSKLYHGAYGSSGIVVGEAGRGVLNLTAMALCSKATRQVMWVAIPEVPVRCRFPARIRLGTYRSCTSDIAAMAKRS